MTTAWILGRGGMLGSNLSHALKRRRIAEYVPAEPIVWHAETADSKHIENAVREFGMRVQHAETWQIFWAAGIGTMGSTDTELADETRILTALLHNIASDPILPQKNGLITFASSAGAVYAGCTDDVITEYSEPLPINAYGHSKLEQEKLLSAFVNNQPTISLFIARISNLYGTGQSKAKKQGLLSHIARCILLRKPINIFVPFDTIRDYITTDDAVGLLLDTLQYWSGTTKIMTKIIASETPTTIAQIIGSFKVVTRTAPRIITSTNTLRHSYTHRMCFRSVVEPKNTQRKTSLLIGIANVMTSERQILTQARDN